MMMIYFKLRNATSDLWILKNTRKVYIFVTLWGCQNKDRFYQHCKLLFDKNYHIQAE